MREQLERLGDQQYDERPDNVRERLERLEDDINQSSSYEKQDRRGEREVRVSVWCVAYIGL